MCVCVYMSFRVTAQPRFEQRPHHWLNGVDHQKVDGTWITLGPPLTWPIQDIVLFLGLCAQINTHLCAPTLCLGTPPHPVIAHTIAQYDVSLCPPDNGLLQYIRHNIGNGNIV